MGKHALRDTRGIYHPPGAASLWLRYTPSKGAKQIRVSLHTADLSTAIQRAQALRATPTLAPSEEWAKTVKQYVAERRREGRLSLRYAPLRELVLIAEGKRMGWSSPAGLTTPQVEEWYHDLRAQRSESTATNYLTCLRSFLGWCVERKRVRENAAASVRKVKLRAAARSDFVSRDRVRELIAKCPREDLRFVLYCGFHCGLRRGEICNALGDWFDLDARTVQIRIRPRGTFGKEDPGWEPKFGRERTVPLSSEFAAWLKGSGLLQRGAFVLHPEKKETGLDGKYRWDFRRPFADHIPGVRIHDMRRTFGSLKASAGVSLYLVATWLGDDLKTTAKHYAHLSPEARAEIDRGL